MKAEIIQWPDSQACVGCVHGSLILDTEKFGSSAYICSISFYPDGKGEVGCSKHIEEEKE